MSGGGGAVDCDRRRYWKSLFPIAWSGALNALVTLDGTVPLRSCELAPRWDDPVTGKTIMRRHVVYDTFDQLYGELAGGNCPCSTLQVGGLIGEERGLFMIDIDIDDYDRGGVCGCKTHEICDTCWTALIDPARRVMDHVFGTVFGFSRMFDYYTGRRGIRRCICDARAVNWTREQRQCVVSKFTSMLDDSCHGEFLRSFGVYPKIDAPVTVDPHHLKNLPLMPNPHTRNICVPLSDVDDGRYYWVPSMAQGPNEMSAETMEFCAQFIKTKINPK